MHFLTQSYLSIINSKDMKKRVIYILLLLIVSTGFTVASRAPIKWGKILQGDINMKVYPSDTSASAVVLCDYGSATVGPRTEYTRIVRMKILKKEGLKYATIEIPYRYFNRYDVFTDLQAETFNVNYKGELVRSKLKNRYIKDVTIDNKHMKKVFTFSDVQVGSIVEYKYTIRSLDFVKLRNWYFQSTIPVQWSEYWVSVSTRFNYLVTFQTGAPLSLDEQKGYADRLQWLYNTKIKKARFALSESKDKLFSSPNTDIYFAWGRSFRYLMKDMPAIKTNPNIPALEDYYSMVKVHLYLADGNFPFYYRPLLLTSKEDYDANENYRDYQRFMGYIVYWLPTWEEANKKWLADERFGMRLIKGFDFKPILDTVMDKGEDQMKTAHNIFDYVKNNVRWDSTYSMFADRDLDFVLKKKSASSGEMNLMVITLLRRAGIKVDPVLIRTLNMGRIENMYPEFHQFNHVIAKVEIGGKTFYLDASNNGSFDQLPRNINGATGWVVKKEGANFEVVNGKNKIDDIETIYKM